jgi:hypothetical protein
MSGTLLIKQINQTKPNQKMLCKKELFNQPYFSIFAFGFSIWKVQVNQEGLKLNVTHQLLVYADVNLLSESMHAIKKKKHKFY